MFEKFGAETKQLYTNHRQDDRSLSFWLKQYRHSSDDDRSRIADHAAKAETKYEKNIEIALEHFVENVDLYVVQAFAEATAAGHNIDFQGDFAREDSVRRIPKEQLLGNTVIDMSAM